MTVVTNKYNERLPLPVILLRCIVLVLDGVGNTLLAKADAAFAKSVIKERDAEHRRIAKAEEAAEAAFLRYLDLSDVATLAAIEHQEKVTAARALRDRASCV